MKWVNECFCKGFFRVKNTKKEKSELYDQLTKAGVDITMEEMENPWKLKQALYSTRKLKLVDLEKRIDKYIDRTPKELKSYRDSFLCEFKAQREDTIAWAEDNIFWLFPLWIVFICIVSGM